MVARVLRLSEKVSVTSSRFEDPQFGTKGVQQIVDKYAKIGNYPLPPLYYAFEQWRGNEFYEHLISTSYIVNNLFESQIHIVYVKAPKPIKRGEKIPLYLAKPPLEQEETEWKHAFALIFFNLTLTKPRQPKTKKYKPSSNKSSIKKSQKRNKKSRNSKQHSKN